MKIYLLDERGHPLEYECGKETHRSWLPTIVSDLRNKGFTQITREKYRALKREARHWERVMQESDNDGRPFKDAGR